MGVYDMLTDGDRTVQVKCWDRLLETFHKGDMVPPYAGEETYTIILPYYEDARFALITKGIFKGLTNEVNDTWEPYITKWGGETELSVDQDKLNPVAIAIEELKEEL